MMELDINYLTKRWKYLRGHRAFQKAPAQSVFRTGWWALHCFLGIPATIELPRWNCQFFLPPKFRRAGSTGIFITREDYEPELAYLEQVLSPGAVFIDGGANLGIYTVVAAKLVGKTGRVLSFEPGAESFSMLERNVQINQLDNVKTFNLGLSNRKAKARLYHIDNAPNSYSLATGAEVDTSFEEISTTTISDVLDEEGLDRVDFIKLDVEGAEELVLQGAKSVIEKMRPIVLFEVSRMGASRFGLSKDGAGIFLKELGYKFWKVRKNGELNSIDFPEIGNNIAIPE